MELDALFSDKIDVPPPPEPFDAKQLPSHGGVWLLTDEGNRPIQLGGCESLRRSLTFRLSSEDPKEPPPANASTGQPDPAEPAAETRRPAMPSRPRTDVRAITRRIWWWPTHSPFETTYDYLRIARAIYPDRYRDLLAFGPAWFIRVDLSARIPRPTVTDKVFADDAQYFGPFPGRSSCSEYVDRLVDLFSLCRHPEILEKVPRGQRCAYYDMGKCTAPCDGSSPIDYYRGLVAYAVQFVNSGPQEFIEQTEREMKRAAAAQEYERAAAAKRRIDQARKMLGDNCRFVRSADHFRWLIVLRGRGRTQVKPFFVHGGSIARGEPVALKAMAEHAQKWIETLHLPPTSPPPEDRRVLAEHVWLVSHFLFRSGKRPGLFLHSEDLSNPEDLGRQIREEFAQPTAPSDDAPSSNASPADDSKESEHEAPPPAEG